MDDINKKRYQKAVISPINIGLIGNRNPYLVMWWGAAFPGFPQISMCKYISGVILILWEFFVNLKSHLNLAMVYSFTGRFELAKEVLDIKWILIYIPVYAFGIWDTRQLVLNTNKFSILADSARAYEKIYPAELSWFDNNLLDKKRPAIAVFWSFLFPGLGHLYIYRLPTAICLIVWVVTISYFSNILPAIHLTFLGNFNEATAILDPQWALFFPSLYGFAIHDAYAFCVRQNKLFDTQQSQYLVDNQQPQNFQGDFFSKRVGVMNIIASFASSLYVELAILELKRFGIKHDEIFAIPLHEQKKTKNINAINGEGYHYFEIAIAIGTAFAVLGTVYGFIWYAGPVIWGLIGFISGSVLGLTIDLIVERKKIRKKLKKGKGGEIMLVIHCEQDKAQMVKDVLFEHFTLGVSVVDFHASKGRIDLGQNL